MKQYIRALTHVTTSDTCDRRKTHDTKQAIRAIPVMRLMQVMLVQVMQVMKVLEVMQVSVPHLWVDFRVILGSFCVWKFQHYVECGPAGALKVFFRKFLSLKVAPPQSEGEQELMLPDVCSESWLTSQTKDGQLSEFISGRLSLSPCLVVCLKELLTSTLLLFIKLNAHTGLGPGQLVGRQVLGSPVLGDIQLSLCDKRGNLEVEVRPVRESQKLEDSV